MNLATAEEFRAEIARLQADVERLRLTDAERKYLKAALSEAEENAALTGFVSSHARDEFARDATTISGLLERLG